MRGESPETRVEGLGSRVSGDGEAGESPPSDTPTAQTDDSGSVSRRAAVAALGLVPLAAAVDWKDAVDKFTRAPRAVSLDPRPETLDSGRALKFFTPHEYATVRVLADLVIPADERSGSATDAKVPEWMDVLLADASVTDQQAQVAMRGGLAWMDRECHRRWGKTFVACAPAERTALLDDIAWPKKARPEVSQGAAFFSAFRDLVASGFWSSEMGVKDLQYIGNTFVREWRGCPPEALAKLGVAYAD
jgi:gluconate 2-dehydrogenase gamma chain